MNVLVETGVKAVDLYAPLARGGRLAIRGERGSGQAVVAFEIVHNVCTRTKATAHFFVVDDPEQFRRGLRESGIEAEVSPSSNATYAELRKDGQVLGTIVLGDNPEAQSWVTLSRALLKSGQLPAVDATQSGTRLELGDHSELAGAARESVAEGSMAGASILAFLRQWFTVAEPWTGQPGEYVSLEQTLSGVRQFVRPRA
jgi:F0F1-type ATP synthase beta subunit